ncbi:MAG: hypothetical protein AAF694_00865 [Bacteroidota bacterium]
MNKLIYLFLIFLFTSCLDLAEDSYQNTSFVCEYSIPCIEIDSVDNISEKRTYFLSDTFSVADWNYYKEVIFFLWEENCFEKSGLSFQDSVEFVFFHDSRNIVLVESYSRFEELVTFRKNLYSYHNFFSKNYHDYNFRDASIILRHYYGKFLAKDPRDDIMYNENVFDFLIQFNFSCNEGTVNPTDKELIVKLSEELHSRKGMESIAKSFASFINDCGNEKKPQI